MKIAKMQSTAAWIFASDPPRFAWLLVNDLEPIRKKLGAKAVEFLPNADRSTIVFRAFQLPLGERRLSVLTAAVTDVELAVTVDGETQEAIDAAKGIWDLIGDLAGDEADLKDQKGAWTYKTTTVVDLPGLVTRVIPAVPRIRQALRDAGRRTDARGTFRLSLPVSYEVHGFPVVQEVVIEPRLAATEEDDIYYVSSPLDSSLHLKLLESLTKT